MFQDPNEKPGSWIARNRDKNLSDWSFFVPVAGIIFQTATNSSGLCMRTSEQSLTAVRSPMRNQIVANREGNLRYHMPARILRRKEQLMRFAHESFNAVLEWQQTVLDAT